MGHITIFLQIFSLLIGGLVCLYIYLAQKTVKEPVVRPLYFFLLFSTLVILTELIGHYLGLNMEHIHGSSSWLQPAAIYLLWSGVAYTLVNFALARTGKRRSSFMTGLFGAGVVVSGFLFLSGIVVFQINTAYLHICEAKALPILPELVMIGILACSLPIERRLRRGSDRRPRSIFGWLLAGYLALFVFAIMRRDYAFWTSLVRLYLIVALIIWFKTQYLKNGSPAPDIDTPKLAEAIGLRYGISNREKEILTLILEGKNNKEIEQALFISASTIRNHVSSLYGKIGINSRGQLMNLALKIRKDRP
jgi:DNA-binding CsgD family transcriptional regulator